MSYKDSIVDISLIHKDYNTINDFVKKFPKLTLSEFDHYTVSDLNLFAVRDDINNDEIKETLDKISACMPAINRIFIKPIIQLVELEEVVPIEAVRTVNNKTMQHIAVHSELWDNVKEDGIKPLKLMSRTYNDNFSIYENIVFARTIDVILGFLKRNIKRYKNLIYASKIIEFNILERLNHLEYFLAIGKLHTGYIREYDKYSIEAKPIYDEMNSINDKLSSKLKYNVYRKNKNYKGKITLRQTNILHMQKDYHKVYNLYKYFDKHEMIVDEMTVEEISKFNDNYYNYCIILLIFSLIHFGFSCNKDVIIDLNDINLTLENRGWTVNIYKSMLDTKVINIDFMKDKLYRIVLEPLSIIDGKLSVDRSVDKESIDKKELSEMDEYYILSPVEDIKNTEVLSIYDIDSFRLLQQFILRGMVNSDGTFNDCPFCNGKLEEVKEENSENEKYICKKCNTVIASSVCEIKKEKYYYTLINNYNMNSVNNIGMEDMPVSFKMHYRNITDITENGDIVCPVCNKVHKKNI